MISAYQYRGRKTIVKEKKTLIDQFKKLSENYDLYIVGAGRFGTVLGKWMNQNQVIWKGYLDRTKAGEVLNDKNIFNTFGNKGKRDYFIISSVDYCDEMKDDLIKQGVSENMIFSFENDELLYDIYEETDDWKKYTQKVKRFKDCHKNDKRCFIIGNGPSLKIEDLEKLCDDVTFASNLIYTIYDSTDWRPNYYVTGDPIFCDRMLETKENVKKLVLGCEAAFISAVGKGFKFRDDSELQMLYFLRRKTKVDEDTQLPYFSDDCSEIVYNSGTVTYVMLQLAVYMGFNSIYLLGIDFSYSQERHKDETIEIKNITNYMEPMQKDAETFQYSQITDIDLQKDGYMAAKKYADENGIKIYNATRGGKLEVFERVDFDSLF